MDTGLEDVWYNWLGSSYQSIRFLKNTPKKESSETKGKKPISKVEEHISNLTQSLSETQVALAQAGDAEKTARDQHAGCAEALTKQKNVNQHLEQEMRRLYGELEESQLKRDDQAAVHERLKERISELVGKIKQAEKDADETRHQMDHERLIHLQEREALRVVHAAHEDCLASLRAAQETLVAYQEDLALRDGIIQNLKRHKSRISSKLGYFSSSLRRTAKELEDTKKRLAQVSDQLGQAEQIIQQHFTMLSSLETYKQRLAEELGHLRSNYEDRTQQLVRMRETLLEKNDTIAELRDQVEEQATQLRDTKSRALSTQQELADTVAGLATAKEATTSAERDILDIREHFAKVSNEKDHTIAEMDSERKELRMALEAAWHENDALKSDLVICQTQASTSEERLAEEIAAHSRTSAAAEAQRLRLQHSIDDLRSNLERANGDLKQTRETLFALNEKCHSLARAQMSLASYQKRTKILLDTEQTHKRHDSGTFVDDFPPHEREDTISRISTSDGSSHDFHNDDDDDDNDNVNNENNNESNEANNMKKCDVNVAFMLKVKARQQVVHRLQQSAQRSPIGVAPEDVHTRGPESIFEPINTEGTHAPASKARHTPPHLDLQPLSLLQRQQPGRGKVPGSLFVDFSQLPDTPPITPASTIDGFFPPAFSTTTSSSTTTTSSTRPMSNATTASHPSLFPQLSSSSSASAQQQHQQQSQHPKRVRFADEGYQTDEEVAADSTLTTTSEHQIWDIIGNLDRARRGFKTVKRRQRQKNLQLASGAATDAV